MADKIKTLADCAPAELREWLTDAAKNWLAHDGLWFRAVEEECGLEMAIKLDIKAWEKFSVVEAQRIMKHLNLPPNGGIPALIQALQFRLYTFINKQEIIEVTDRRCVFRMNTCRVQESRQRQGLPEFQCKPVGMVEFTNFAKAIDPRIQTRCLTCPPDKHPDTKSWDCWCAWEFTVSAS